MSITSYKFIIRIRITNTYLRGAHFVEQNKGHRLDEPCEDQIMLTSSEKEARPEHQRHLWDKAYQG